MNNEEKAQLLKKCEELKRQIDSNTEFVNTPLKKIEIVNKLLKHERKKRWRIKRRRLQRVQNSFFRSMVAERNKYLYFFLL